MVDVWCSHFVAEGRWREAFILACLEAHDGNVADVAAELKVSVADVAAVRDEVSLGLVKRDNSVAAVAQRVLDEWVFATRRDSAKVKMNAKRLAAVRARLKEGYTEDDLVAAVHGISKSAWHCGDNPSRKRYDDLLVAIRDGERVEKFRDLYEAGGDGPKSAVDQVLASMGAFDLIGLEPGE